MAILVNLQPVETATDELNEALNALRQRNVVPRRSGSGWVARCPTHADAKASLSLSEGDNGRLIMHCHAGCDFSVVKAALGIPDRKPPGQNDSIIPSSRRIVATYPYVDENYEVLFEAIRYEPKDFRQRLPDGTPRLGDVRRVLYQLPSVIAAASRGDVIYVAEGEKDVLTINDVGSVATCSPMGAGKWRDEYADHLAGASAVIIIADRDAPGIKHAEAVAASCLERGIPHVIKQAATGKDASDHLEAGLTLDDLDDYTRTTDIPDADDDQPTTQLAWTPLDLVTLGDTPRIPPELGSLIYTGRRHLLSGESESGKSWLGFGIAADELKNGYGVVWVDLDYMGAQDILERLRQLGVRDHVIRERFAFYQPEGRLEGDNLFAVTDLIQHNNARLVVIDAFTGFCALHNLKPNDGIDIEHAYRLMQPLCDTHAAVIILDHVVKDSGSRGRYAAGSERKLSGADVAIGFTLIDHYGRGRTGRSRLTVHKDRPAQLQRPTAGIFVLDSHPDTHQVTWRLEEDHSKADDGTWRPTGIMEGISKWIELEDRTVQSGDIDTCIRARTEHIREARKRLVSEGYLHEMTHGKAKHYTLLKPYREADE